MKVLWQLPMRGDRIRETYNNSQNQAVLQGLPLLVAGHNMMTGHSPTLCIAAFREYACLKAQRACQSCRIDNL